MSWIVFDKADAEPLSRAGIDCSSPANQPAGDAIASALASPGDSVLLVPSAIAGRERQVLLLRVKKMRPSPDAVPDGAPSHNSASDENPRLGFASSGILGLDGDPEYLDELPERKPWWEKIF